ncbi:MAG: hypothetical protein AAF657_18840 [Acidobacteriota bacterium]
MAARLSEVRRVPFGRVVCFVVILMLGLVSSASAQLAGVRVTPTVASTPTDVCGGVYPPPTFTVDASATVFYSTGIGFSSAWLGDTSGFGANAPAIDWGDGSTLPPLYPSGLPFDTTSTPPGAPGPMRAYRASFSHTYSLVPSPVITVYSHNLLFASGYAFTGNTVTVQTPTYSVFGGTRMLLTNTAQVLTPAVATCEIDTVSDTGFLLLALAMAAAGLVMLRR